MQASRKEVLLKRMPHIGEAARLALPIEGAEAPMVAVLSMQEEGASMQAVPVMPEEALTQAAPAPVRAAITAAALCMGAGACMLAAAVLTPGAAFTRDAGAQLLEAGAMPDTLAV
jgi:hypothetical protein